MAKSVHPTEGARGADASPPARRNGCAITPNRSRSTGNFTGTTSPGSIAHAKMLARIGVLKPRRTGRHRRRAGGNPARRSTRGQFKWRTDLEDVHMNIEAELTARYPAGAKLHTGRSRNDQVATAMRLWLKDQIAANRAAIAGLASRRWTTWASRDIKVVIPGYTHLQRAQPVLLAHHLLAYVEMLERDYERLADCAEAGRRAAARLRRDCGQHAAARPRVRARSCSASRASRKTRWTR